MKICSNHSAQTSHNSTSWYDETTQDSVVIIASSQPHNGQAREVESPRNSQEVRERNNHCAEIKCSKPQARTSQCETEQSNEYVQQVSHSIVIIASQDCENPLDGCTVGESEQSVVPDSNYSDILPSKLLSLSLSLLVAAFFQAIRCLQEIIEETFRTLHCDLDIE